MMFRNSVIPVIIFILSLVFLPNFILAQDEGSSESDQQIGDFSLAGYGEKGQKTWDIAGKSADIFDNLIKLNDVVGNLYSEKEQVRLTAERGNFDKAEGKVHLEENVLITTSSGAELTTDSLDWDRKKQIVTTDDTVNIVKENMVTTARGAQGEPNLNKVILRKDVQVDIKPEIKEGSASSKGNKIVIVCDGPLEIDYTKNIATFNNNVKVDTQDNLIYSDVMNVYFTASDKGDTKKTEDSPGMMGTKIDKIIARGNVKIIKGENISYSEEAIYSASDKKVILKGAPKLVIYSAEELNASFGN